VPDTVELRFMDKHKLIGAKIDILRVLFGVLFGILMEYSTQ
jgi:hypothetical protein